MRRGRPVEIHQVHLRPADFFTANPAIDVPSTKNGASVLVNGAAKACCDGKTNGENPSASGSVQHEAVSHFQGGDVEV